MPDSRSLLLVAGAFALLLAGCGTPAESNTRAPLPDADRSTVEVSQALGVRANGQDLVRVTVTVRQADGAPLAGRTVTLALSGEGNALTQPTGPTDSDGVTVAYASATRAGVKVLTVTVDDPQGPVTLAAHPTVEFVSPAASRLAVISSPQQGVAGVPLNEIVIALQDTDGAPVREATGLVTLSLGDAPGSAVLEGTLTANTIQGVARFPDIVLKRAGTGYTLRAEAPGLVGAQTPAFDVTSGPATSLVLSNPSSTLTAGEAATLEISALDAFGNLATRYGGTIRFSGDPTDVLPADATFTAADAGRRSFTGLMLKRAGARQITVQDLVSATLSVLWEVAVQPAAPAKLVLTQQPTQVSVRAPFAATAQVRDAFDNVVTGPAPEVTLGLVEPGASLEGSVTRAPTAGVASFTGLSIPSEGTYRLKVSAAPALETTGAPFDVLDDVPPAQPVLNAGPASARSLTVQWTASGDDGVLGTAAACALRYASSPIVTDADFAAATSVPCAAPRPAGAAESATLTGLQPQTTYFIALMVIDNAGNAVRSDTLSLSTEASLAAALRFEQQPVPGTAGQSMAPVRVALVDDTGAVVPSSAEVTLSVQGAAGYGPFSATAVAGVATFDALRIDRAGTGLRLVATSGALAPLTSDPFDVEPAAAASFSIWLAPGASPTAASPLELTVTAHDPFGNQASGYRGTVRFGSTDGSAQLPADYTFAPADSGSHSFSVTPRTAGATEFSVADLASPSLAGRVELEVQPGPAVAFELQLPLGPVAAGDSVEARLTALDSAGNVATGYTGTVHFTSSDPTAQVPADYAFAPMDGGMQTFAVVPKTAGTQTLTVAGLPSGIPSASASFPVLAGAASRLAFLSQPDTRSVRAALPVITVAITDAYGNVVPTSAGEVTLALSGGNAAAVLSGAKTASPTEGLVHFFGLSVDQEGSGYRLQASGLELVEAASTAFDVVDDVAPAAAALTVTGTTSTRLTLSWEAVGDDGLLGFAGAYDLRYATWPILGDDFALAEPLPTGAPKTPGETESVTVTGLTPSTRYYFALVVRDGAGNASTFGTVDAQTTADPCIGVSCSTTQPPHCAADGRTLHTTSANCADVAGTATCQETETTTLCPGEQGVCFEGACATASSPVAGALAVSELMHSPSAGTTEYLELYNPTDALIDLRGLTVRAIGSVGEETSHTISVSGPPVLVGPKGYIVLARNGLFDGNGGVSADYVYGEQLSLGSVGRVELHHEGILIHQTAYTEDFPPAVGAALSLSSLVIGTAASEHPWFWCLEGSPLAGGDFGSPGTSNGACGPPPAAPVDYCNIQWPQSFAEPVQAGSSATVFSRWYEPGATDWNLTGNDYYPHVESELGYGQDPADPAGWVWGPATFNPFFSELTGSDEVQATLTIFTAGSWFYGFRYRLRDPTSGALSPWTYCGQGGVTVPPAGTWGTVTVTPP